MARSTEGRPTEEKTEMKPADELDDGYLFELVCPINREPFSDAVEFNDRYYNRGAINAHLRMRSTDPMTRATVSPSIVRDAPTVNRIVAEYKRKVIDGLLPRLEAARTRVAALEEALAKSQAENERLRAENGRAHTPVPAKRATVLPNIASPRTPNPTIVRLHGSPSAPTLWKHGKLATALPPAAKPRPPWVP